MYPSFNLIFLHIILLLSYFWLSASEASDSGSSPSGSPDQTAGSPPGEQSPPAITGVTTGINTTKEDGPFRCRDKIPTRQTEHRNSYVTFQNHIRANRTFRCWESITYTTHGDFWFLDHLEPLVERWKGPISLALFAPRNVFVPTLMSIKYLRDCGSPLIAEYVTFHIYFPSHHRPKFPDAWDTISAIPRNCSSPPPGVNKKGYKGEKNRLYPINRGRNIARKLATTYFVLASDIDLYPSPGVIPDFLEMFQRKQSSLKKGKRKVFPLPVFEIKAGLSLPGNKAELVSMLKNYSANVFHKEICPQCHKVPGEQEWIAQSSRPGLNVFRVGKREGSFKNWDPVFIGTRRDPSYDVRLSWEGKKDRITQGYAMCALDYEFHILDNAFLVHKPGIEASSPERRRDKLVIRDYELINFKILGELKARYGWRRGCSVWR